MNKRIAKKYRPIRELWNGLKVLTFGMDFLEMSIDSAADRVEEIEEIQSTNTQAINRKFEEYDKRIDRLEREIKKPKKPWYKR